ncbi:hypothetical protein CTI12_AA247520 [Artemisia annua]|uniref:Uncharacterized protein n=1 Tax=Artemisia annua TaxID=35608 RepID=A0A2U1NNG5_ARTAN|nr:hypothetical protein CTI12_AA247520 [Artemisia annua]
MVTSTMNFVPLVCARVCSFTLFLSCICIFCFYPIIESQNERVGGCVECSSLSDGQHSVVAEVGSFVDSLLPIGFCRQDDECVSGSDQDEHSLAESHQLHVSPNIIPFATHSVPLPVAVPIVGTSSVLSIAVDTHVIGRPVMLEFQQGIVRYEVTDDITTEYTRGPTSIERASRKRMPMQIYQVQGPLQRRRTDSTDMPVCTSSSRKFDAPAVGASSVQGAQPLMPVPASMPSATPISEQGPSIVQRGSRKRRAIQITKGQRPSQRPRKNPPYTSSYTPSSGGLATSAVNNSSMQRGQPSTFPAVFPTHAAPTFEGGNGMLFLIFHNAHSLHPWLLRDCYCSVVLIRVFVVFKVHQQSIRTSVLAIACAEVAMHFFGMKRDLVPPRVAQARCIIDVVWAEGSARDKLVDANVPEFKIRLFGKVGSAQHELPTADELFSFGEQGYHTDLRLLDALEGSLESNKRMSIDAYLHICCTTGLIDRPDVVDRVFERKIHMLLKYIRDQRPFGSINAGLPHCHILLWNDAHSKIRSPEDVDKFISDELQN